MNNVRLGAKQTLALGFAAIIITGALLLMLPMANKSGQAIHFLDALFTAASATCVTGLVLFDTWTQFTFFGQVIILLLIQIGGLGFMTIVILFSMVLGKRIGLRERSYLMEAVSSLQISGVVRLVKHVLIGTLIFELVGSLILGARFYGHFGMWESVWLGIFHSISAFCNAGFDLMGSITPYTSLMPFASDVIVNFTIMGLIITGGIGFVVWEDIFKHRLKFKRYSLHSKVVLTATAILIVFSTLVFMVVEAGHTLKGMDFGNRLIASMFQTVTPRTAGFNTLDTASLSEGGTLLTMVLMIIGASPGSTAGGMKITTFVIILISMTTYFRKYEDVNLFNRRLEQDLVKRAYYSATLYVLLIFVAGFIIVSNQSVSIKAAMFEAASAIGTVGLTTGLTRDLTSVSKIVIILLMYIGRLGSLSVLLAVTEKRLNKKTKNPEGKIIIG